jgi:hypothetical protein
LWETTQSGENATDSAIQRGGVRLLSLASFQVMKFPENWESGLPSLRPALKFMTFSTLFLLFVQY